MCLKLRFGRYFLFLFDICLNNVSLTFEEFFTHIYPILKQKCAKIGASRMKHTWTTASRTSTLSEAQTHSDEKSNA